MCVVPGPPLFAPPPLHTTFAAAPPLPRGGRFDAAVEECSAALESQPNFFKALQRRAKAYELLGQPKAALADLQRANRLDAATPDSRVRCRRRAACGEGKQPIGCSAWQC